MNELGVLTLNRKQGEILLAFFGTKSTSFSF